MAKTLSELRLELQAQLANLEAEEAAEQKRKADDFIKVFSKIAVRAAKDSAIESVDIKNSIDGKMRADLTKLFRKYVRERGNDIAGSIAMPVAVLVTRSVGEGA